MTTDVPYFTCSLRYLRHSIGDQKTLMLISFVLLSLTPYCNNPNTPAQFTFLKIPIYQVTQLLSFRKTALFNFLNSMNFLIHWTSIKSLDFVKLDQCFIFFGPTSLLFSTVACSFFPTLPILSFFFSSPQLSNLAILPSGKTLILTLQIFPKVFSIEIETNLILAFTIYIFMIKTIMP